MTNSQQSLWLLKDQEVDHEVDQADKPKELLLQAKTPNKQFQVLQYPTTQATIAQIHQD